MGETKKAVRVRNWRLTAVGAVLVGGSAAFFVGMQAIAPRSNDPVDLMRTIGQVSGIAGGIGVTMVIVGMIGRRSPA